MFGFVLCYLLAALVNYVVLVRRHIPLDLQAHLSLAWESLLWPVKLWA